MHSLRSPSGRLELELLPEVGGRIHALRVDGVDVLRTPADLGQHALSPLTWGSYPMVPWCNRIPGGELWFEGIRYRQPITLDTFAIHGRAFAARWMVLNEGTLEFTDPGDEGYPWPYRCQQVFVVSDDAVSLTLTLENTGRSRMPAGLGIHPWFAAVGQLEIALPADFVYPSVGNIPTGPPQAVSGLTDLRESGAPPRDIDECWTGLTAHAVELYRPADGLRFEFSFSPTADHVLLAAITPLDAVALEPQTHGVDGHARRERGEPGAIGVLEPGEVLTVSYTLRFLE